jgi:hypothetical protein
LDRLANVEVRRWQSRQVIHIVMRFATSLLGCIATLGACTTTRPTTAVAPPALAAPAFDSMHVDPAGDTRPLSRGWGTGPGYPAPDIRSLAGYVQDGVLLVRLVYAPSTYDPARTRAFIYVDSDFDERTGTSGPDWQAGADYSLETTQGRYFVFSHRGGYSPTGVGGTHETRGDTLAIRFPLRSIRAGNGPVRISAATTIAVDVEEGATSLIIDTAPGGHDQPTGWVVAPVRAVRPAL